MQDFEASLTPLMVKKLLSSWCSFIVHVVSTVFPIKSCAMLFCNEPHCRH